MDDNKCKIQVVSVLDDTEFVKQLQSSMINPELSYNEYLDDILGDYDENRILKIKYER